MRVLLRWGMGFVIASVGIWIVGIFCITPEYYRPWNQKVGDYLPQGSVSCRVEGWGTVFFGKDGLLGARTPLSPSDQNVVFYGDSFVQSLQVGDSHSVFTCFTKMARAEGLPWRGLGVAQGYRDFSAHIHFLPIYAKQIPHCSVHVVVFSSIDVTPNGKTLLADSPEPCRFIPRKQPFDRLRFIVARCHLQAFANVLRSAVKAMESLRLRPGPVTTPQDEGDTAPQPAIHTPFWDSLLSTLKRRTEGQRVVLVYHPSIPTLRQGTVDYADPFATSIREIESLCRKHQIEFLDLTPVFCEYTRRTGQLPNGFSNSYPGKGHWNSQGHRLVARAVLDYLMATPSQD